MTQGASTGRLVVSARPRFEIEGEETSRLATDLLRLEITHDEEGMARMEATLLNWGRREESEAPGFLYFDRATLDLGKRILVKAGNEDTLATIFDGTISAMAGLFPDLRPPELRISAEDALMKMRMRERTRFHEREDEGGMLSRIAADHGLDPNAEAEGSEHRELWQVNQNDLSFLRERARAADARIELSGRELRFLPRRRPSGGEPIRLSKEDALIHFEAVADLSHQRTEVRVHGWSVADKAPIHEVATGDDIAAESRGGETGPAVLDDLGWTAPLELHLEAPATAAEARAIARAVALQRARRFLVGRGTTDGTPALAVGAEVELLDVGDLFSGRWNVCAVRHTWNLVDGLRTHFRVERVDLGGSA
ncbi:hypothetical protein WME91_16000 [Sorangium sp. So ce269]